MPLTPTDPIRSIPHIGPRRAQSLEELGIDRVSDLLLKLFPYRYEDRRHPIRIADLGHHVEEPVLLRGEVRTCGAKVSPVKRMKIFEAMLEDGSGAVMLVWFNQPYLSEQIHRGDKLSVYGVPRLSHYRRLQIEGPEWETWNEGDEGAIVPIYSKVPNIAPKALRQMIATACETLPLLGDPLPPALRQRLGVIDLAPALHDIHRPQELTAEFLRQRSPAHLRVILQEFFTFQLALRVRRATEEVKRKTRRIEVNDAIRAEVKRILPFKLTGAQKRVVKEIADDLRSEKPMYRLLQGDVGSGKTIVALIAAIISIRNGHQAALLAPTEILVEQHFQRIRQLLGDKIVVAKATGSMGAGERRTLLAGLRDGFIQLVVGTHALLEERVVFKSLGLAIVDEQHRFGVEQRQRLFAKADMPDILVMTATPIPRSLALAIFGDLELSVIDELPPGRTAVKTAVRTSKELDRVYAFIDEELDAGAQAYVVFPIIEESEKLNVKALTLGFDAMTQRFAKRRIAMLHGRMSATEKEETMELFKSGELDMLVSTTVIEVGIDVPNASIMLIFDADRFGLSQLHQLRGRVGRGMRKSYCILVSDGEKGRLDLFAKTPSGFTVAEHDLELRGPGEFLGTKQSGVPRFRFGNIVRDHALMEKARDVAIETVERGVKEADALARGLVGIAVAEAGRD
ncbi:MAG TPA: ATP-dependent DNA helicase RecG [Thermoanaerobaculia bacterium]|nr:ATP-dependent DNA helicase RecG [Thermoanaerobaculia bacterium]